MMTALRLVIPLVCAWSCAAQCDPMTAPVLAGNVRSPSDELNYEFGSRQVTYAEVQTYMEHVSSNSDRVVMGELSPLSVEGRALSYAIIGAPDRVNSEAARLQVSSAAQELLDPKTSQERAAQLAASMPAILWVAANVHGNEPSGTDASLQLLYYLSDRTDCAATQILDNAMVIVLPSQNPDGRENGVRRNSNGFDMNRDWFAATQPETQAKRAMLKDWPPILFIDAHEMGGSEYFFPPNADPVYHEADVGWINDVFGAAMAEEFTKQGIPFFTGRSYDLFYAGYGDSFPTLAYSGAAMTFEKGGSAPYPAKVYEQFLAIWVSVSAAATNKVQLLEEWHEKRVAAEEQGQQGTLQPNRVYNEGSEVEFEVPDILVRDYFLFNVPGKELERFTVLDRLMQAGIDVYTLQAPLLVPDLTRYGREPRSEELPIGTLRIPTAQGSKHLVQALLQEDSYVPFTYFYDVTGWSSPMLENLPGAYSSGVLPSPAPDSRILLSDLRHPNATDFKFAERVSVLKPSATNQGESFDFLLFTLRQWGLLPTALLPEDVASGLGGATKLIVPAIASPLTVLEALGAEGRSAIEDWVQAGGLYIGYGGGAVLGAALGVNSQIFESSTSSCPGALFRVMTADPDHPLLAGVGQELMQYYADAALMQSEAHFVLASFPITSPDWFVSGFQVGAEELQGTASVAFEPVGSGASLSFSSEINFRSFTGGSAKLMKNALGVDVVVEGHGASRQRMTQARSAALRYLSSTLQTPIRFTLLASRDGGETSVTDRRLQLEEVIRAYAPGNASWHTQKARGGITLTMEDVSKEGLRQDWVQNALPALDKLDVLIVPTIIT